MEISPAGLDEKYLVIGGLMETDVNPDGKNRSKIWNELFSSFSEKIASNIRAQIARVIAPSAGVPYELLPSRAFVFINISSVTNCSHRPYVFSGE